MSLLGLDLASRLTGWCAGAGETVPQVGAWAFEPAEGDFGFLLDQLDRHLAVAMDRFQPTAVAYEAPVLIARGRSGRAGGDTLAKLRLLYPLGAHVEFVCRRRGVPCYEVNVRTVKKELTGDSLAEKGAMYAMAQKLGAKLPPRTSGGEDAADALAVWLVLLRHMDRRLSAEWDKRIFQPRGAML